MAQTISLLGATYPDVPQVLLPKSGGGTALFADPSVTTATEYDVASGKTFIAADGTITVGQASGGGGTSAISIVDTLDSAGGTVRTITALDISDTTAIASDVVQGKYFYTSDGIKTAGTASGGGAVKPNPDDPVKFWDYDGTLLYSYTDAEALDLTALPSNPSHTGLTAEGWNWTLAEIKSYATDYPDADINVGQTYITSDGNTKLYITLDNTTLHPYLGLAVNGTIEVDWGDNSTPSIMTGSDASTIVWSDHEYSAVGNYVIDISVQSGTFYFSSNTNYGSVFSYNNSFSRNLSYSNILRKALIGSNVLLKNYAFAYSQNLEIVSVPKDCFQTSSSGSFKDCCMLKHATIASSTPLNLSLNSKFTNCYSLQSVSFPKTISTSTSSFNSAFYLCYNLQYLTYPDNVTTYNPNAISNCYSLQKIVLPNSVTQPLTSSFSNLYNLEKIITNKTSIQVNTSSFMSNCYTLREIPFNIEFITSASQKLGSIFYLCYNLEKLPTWTRTTTQTAFSNYVYGSCYKIKNFYLPSDLTDLGTYTFYNCRVLESIQLPSTLTIIGTYCFGNCQSLGEITIPDTVTSIGNSCFTNCYCLFSITLSDSLQSLGTSVFNNCSSLTMLTIPDTVTSIGNSCFSSCTAMQEYHFLRTTPPTLGTTVFSNIPSGCKIYVPYSSDQSILNAYKTATNWSAWASYIEEEPQS